MELNYKKIKEINNPALYLCNPNQLEICEITPETATVTLRLNDISELTLTVNKYISGYNNQNKQIQPCYELLESKRLIKVECIGWFEIKNVTENDGNEGSIKTITAQSHQCSLKDKGFYVEDKVYKFYNDNDPYDDLFDASDISSIPSICGQLHKQLGIKLDLVEDEIFPTQDYKEWTIVYIDNKLRFNESNIYRTLKSETTNGYDFMINTVEKAFEVLWLFDLLTHTIKVKYISSITQPTNIYLSYENLIQNIETTENAENIVTVLNCNGGNDLNISTVNPMGTNYIVNFDYYKNTQWMSQDLIDVLDQWKINYDSKVDEFANLVTNLQTAYMNMAKIDEAITYEELKIKDLNDGRDLYITESPIKLETVLSGENSKCPQSIYYSTVFDGDIQISCHSKPFKYENEKFVPQIDAIICTLNSAYDNGFYYFVDADDTTYCKLIKNDNGILGFERYGTYNTNTKQWCDISEENQSVVTGEVIKIGDKSLFEDSNFYNIPFFKNCDIVFKCYKEPMRNAEDIPSIEGTLDYCAQQEYYYFDDGGIDGQYCKINISAEVDAETNKESYYVSGFSRYVVLDKTNEWINRHENKLFSLKEERDNYSNIAEDILNQMKSITEICNIQKFVKSKDNDGKLYNELQSFWIEGDYTNDTFAMTDNMTLADSIDLSKQLKESGEQQIKKVAQPKFSFNITSLDFLRLKDFQVFAEQLELGKTIAVEKISGIIYEPAITEITFNLYNGENFSMTFSNSARLNGNEFTFADLVAETSSVSKSVSSNWQDLLSYAKEKESITSLIADPLNRVLRAGMGGAINQEFIIDNSGILGRKYTDNDHTSFSNEQVRLINNLILFTDDGWNSTKTALGKIYYKDNGEEKSAYGLIAETIIGDLIMSNALKIKNSETDENSTILLNKDGIIIKDSDNNTLFIADTNGNVSITGQINALSGYIGTKENGFIIDSNSLSHSLSDEDKRVLICTGTTSNYQVHNSGDINQWMLIAGKNFGVTNDGKLFASTGNIAGLELGKQIVKDDEDIIYSGLYCKNFALEIGSDSNGNKFTEIVFRETDDLSSLAVTSLSKNRIATKCGTISTLESDIINSNKIDTGTIKIGGGLTINANGISCQLSVADEDAGTNDDYGILVFEGDKSVYSYVANLIKDGNEFYITVDSELKSEKTFSVFYQNVFGDEQSTTLTISAGNTSSERKNSGGMLYQIWFANTNYNTQFRFQQGSGSSSSTTSYRNLKTNANIIPRAYTPNYTIVGYNLGTADLRWGCLYTHSINTVNAVQTASDKRLKNTITTISDKYDLLFDELKPVTFYLNVDNSKKHLGLIANDINYAMTHNGLNPYNDGIYSEFTYNNEIFGSICYEELIPLNIYEIQKLKKRVADLELKLQKYEAQEG